MQMTVEMLRRTMAIPMAERPRIASAKQRKLRDVNGVIRGLRNAKVRSDQQPGNIAGSMEFGCVKPIRIDCHGMIIARHTFSVRSLPITFAQRSTKL
jgi:hypothetical protein